MPGGSTPRFLQLHNEAWLRQRYVEDRLSAQEIAEEVGCSRVAVSKAAREFGIIKPRGARQGAPRDVYERWLAAGGVLARRPFGREEHLCAREELGLRSVDDLLVLTHDADPFYIDDRAQGKAAQWFADLWEASGSSGHIRRVHYRHFSTEGSTLWDGTPYLNTTKYEAAMNSAARYARILELVDPLDFVDRRNPDPLLYVEPHLVDLPGAYLEDVPDTLVDLPILKDELMAPWLPAPWTGDYGLRELPEPDVYGYDYATADQPVLLEVWIEKTTMNDILSPLCQELGVNLVPAAGMQSITSAVRLLKRCRQHGRPGHVFYVSDFDPAGANMPHAVARQLEFFRERHFPDVDVSLEPIALTQEQVESLDPRLPRKPSDDLRGNRKVFDEGVVELDALEAIHPGLLAQLVGDAVPPYRDPELVSRLRVIEFRASVVASDTWSEVTSELVAEYDQLRAQADQALAPIRDLHADFERQLGEIVAPLMERYRAALEPLRGAAEATLKALAERQEELDVELEEIAEGFDPELPDRPEPTAPEPQDVLFDSRRDWQAQLQRYKR